MTKLRHVSKWFAASFATVMLASPALSQETVNIGICVSWPGYSMYEIARQQNLAPGYDLNLTIFEDPLGGHSALAAGQLDIYLCTGDYTPLAIARGTGVVNVAFLNPSYGVDHIIMAPDVEPSDLRGMNVSAPQAYIGQLLMGLWLDSEGIAPDEVEWVNLNADEAVGPVLSGDLAAAYMYEPWISSVMANLPGARSVVNTADPDMLASGIFMDVMYMNGDFIRERREAAVDMLRVRWDALQYWHENTDEANEVLAQFLQWPKEDVEAVIGTNGKFAEEGIYMLDFDESARICGVLDGEPPFEIGNGAMPDVVRLSNEWWVKLGLMDEVHEPDAGVDCSLMADLVADGYRQSFDARD